MAKHFVENRIIALRRTTQVVSLLAAMVLLLSGQVGLDLASQSIKFFGVRIWPHEVALILLGLALPFVLLAGLSLVFGRLFCGWMCPQTALCELASATQRFVLANRSRGALRRWGAAAGAAILALGVALTAGLAVVSLFVPPGDLLDAIGGQFGTSLLKAVTIASFLMLVNVVLLRHTFCEWMCVVGWWQRIFAGRGALRVAFAPDRARECSRCNDCKAACFMRIDPRWPALPGSCLNCGECVTACRRRMASAPAEGLIAYRFGEARRAGRRRDRGSGLLGAARVAGFAVVFLAVTSLLAWSVLSRDPVQIKVRQAERFAIEMVDGQVEGKYVIDVYNTGSSTVLLELDQIGLPREGVSIAPNPILAAPHERTRASLSFRLDAGQLHSGRNEFLVTASEAGGEGREVSDRAVFGLPNLPGDYSAERPAEQSSYRPNSHPEDRQRQRAHSGPELAQILP